MSWLFCLLLVGQYTDVYVPHEPLYVESGATLVIGAGRFDLSYRPTSTDEDFSSPMLSGLSFSPDGYNELGISLPWLKVTEITTVDTIVDTINHIYLGNLGIHYKRRIIGSLRYGYLAARLFADIPTAKDTLGVKDNLGGRRTLYGIGLSYTYELPLLAEYYDLLGRLPLVGSVSIQDAFLTRDHELKQWEADLSSGFAWGVSFEILPLDYLFFGTALQGGAGEDNGEGLSLIPYAGLRWYWFDLGAAFRMGSQNRFEAQLRLYL